MKKIECFIPSSKFSNLEKSLRDKGVAGLTVTEVKGYGNEQTRPESYLLLPKTKIEVFCHDEDLNVLLDVILRTCRSGQLGDGKIAVYEVAELIRIRTGDRGEVAV